MVGRGEGGGATTPPGSPPHTQHSSSPHPPSESESGGVKEVEKRVEERVERVEGGMEDKRESRKRPPLKRQFTRMQSDPKILPVGTE